jgi:transposase
MAASQKVVAPSGAEVSMVEPELIRRMRGLAEHGWGSKRIASQLGVSRNTVRRYLRRGGGAEVQVRPGRRKLGVQAVGRAIELFEGAAEGNAVVVRDELRRDGVVASVRTVQRVVAGRRRERRAAELATVRFETAPGQQMQIDFGEKVVSIAGRLIRVHLLVAVLSYSRRLFV